MTSFPYCGKLGYKIQPLESNAESNITEDAGLAQNTGFIFRAEQGLEIEIGVECAWNR
jgi:hypothetical protein